jgi:NADH-quinone oxidoreductase subunit H
MPFLITDHWYDLRDLANVANQVLSWLGDFLPHGLVYIIAPIIGFVFAFLLFTLPTQLYLGVLGERRLIGRVQSRLGPNRTGKFGILQPIADALKLLTKEAFTPNKADKAVMFVAPVLFVVPAVLLFAVIPFSKGMIIANVSASLLYFIAVSSIPVLTTFMAGWSHNNKYSLFGAIRIVAMTISFEVPMVLALLGMALMMGTINLQDMVLFQKHFHIWMVVVEPLAIGIYFICVSAELNRTPTDIAEAESEIVAGYLTEYSGMKWGLFYGMDIGYAIAASCFAATVFFGGWSLFGLDQWVPPWIIFIVKVYAFYSLFIWTRATLPRLRSDQLMEFAWKYLLPLALFNIFVVATERMLWSKADFGRGWIYVFAVINIALFVAAIPIWARLIGYRPERTPTRARLVREAGGYVPLSPTAAPGEQR